MFNLFRRPKTPVCAPPEIRPLKQPTITPRNGWIVCTEGLPPHDLVVLVLCLRADGRRVVGLGIHCYGLPAGGAGHMREFFEVKIFGSAGTVIAWKPAPPDDLGIPASLLH